MKSMLIIGLGRFGSQLAIKLSELGNEVMAVDIEEEAVNKVAPMVTAAKIADCMNEEVLKSVGVGNFDICFVCISNNFQSSLEITSLLKELGAKWVVSKTNGDIHAKFLLRNGADEIIYPERDMAQKAAVKYNSKNAFDYIELTPEYSIIEIQPPSAWIGKTIVDLAVRTRYQVNVIGIKNQESIIPLTDGKHIFSCEEHLIIAGNKKACLQLLKRYQ